jgi:hypothetical protein
MQGFIAGVGSTDQERAVYNAFLQDPSAEFDLRSSLADRAYPGVVGDAIKGALSAQYYSTLSTNPIALSQPGFYKNAFKNYMPTGVMTNFVSSAGQELDENTANAVETAAANTVVADGTKDDKVNIEPNQIEKTVESVVNKFDPYVSPQMIADAAKEGTITSAASKATAPATAPVTAPKPTPAPAPAIIDKGVSGLYDIEGWGAPGGSQSPVIPGSVGGGDPSGSIWNPDSPTLAPTIPATQGLGASLGGEMLGYEDPRSLYTGRDRAYAQLFSPNAMQPGANITSPVAPVDTGTPMLDDMGMIAPPATTAPSGVSEMEPGRMDQWRLDDTVRDMDAVNYGITNQAPYKPTGMADYYTEVRDPSEMFDVHSDPAYPNPDAQFLRQYPYSPPATPPGGINMYSPVPVPQVTPGPTGSERLGTPTQPLTGPSNPPGWPGAPPISLDMGGEYGTGVEPIRTHPLEGEFDNALARLGIGGAGRLFRDYLKQGWGIESEMDIQNFMKTPAGMNAFRSFNQPTATNAGFGGSGGIG